MPTQWAPPSPTPVANGRPRRPHQVWPALARPPRRRPPSSPSPPPLRGCSSPGRSCGPSNTWGWRRQQAKGGRPRPPRQSPLMPSSLPSIPSTCAPSGPTRRRLWQNWRRRSFRSAGFRTHRLSFHISHTHAHTRPMCSWLLLTDSRAVVRSGKGDRDTRLLAPCSRGRHSRLDLDLLQVK